MKFRILGPLEVVDEDGPIAFRGAKQRTLLALLLLRSNKVVSRDELIEALWGQCPPRTSRHSLEAHVFRLRKLIQNGNALLETRTGGYVMHVADGEFDLARFERLAEEGRTALHAGNGDEAAELLRRALSLWRGRTLEDVPLDSFAVAEIRVIDERRLTAHENLIEVELARGRHAEVLPELEGLAHANPLRERLQAQLMVALYRSGRQTDALDAYRSARRRLAEDLGIEPGPELRKLEQAVLRHDPALRVELVTGERRDGRTRWRPRHAAAAVSVAALLVASATILALGAGGGSSASPRVPPNSVASLATDGHEAVLPSAGDVSPSAVAVCGSTVWVAYADSDTVAAINSATRTLQRIAVGHKPSGVACGRKLVWVANYLDGTVTRINRATERVVGGPIAVGAGPMSVAYGDGFVWVVNSGDSTVTRIDPDTGTARLIEVGPDPEGIAVTRHAVWVTSRSTNQLWRIDPRSGLLETSPLRVGAGPVSVAHGGGAVWVANELDGTVSRVEPHTNDVRSIPVSHDPNTIAAAADGHSIWVGEGAGYAVSRLDASTGTLEKTERIGSAPTALAAAANGRVYVTTRAGGLTHRGGTLRYLLTLGVVSGHDFRSPTSGLDWWIDPALTLSSYATLMYDGVVGYRRVGGPEGSEVVPDLATAIPAPTDGGRTYVFQLRRGIRFSNGQRVVPDDLRRGLERTFALKSYEASYYSSLVDAHACFVHPSRCDLSRAIVTDAAASTITYHLTRPDPHFLDKLTLPAAGAIPVTTPFRERWPHPPPGTGPYRFVAQKHSFVLTRNPYFHVWSPEAKPDGYVDRMVFSEPPSLAASVRAAEHGRADVAEAGLDFASLEPGLAQNLETEYSDRMRLNPASLTAFLIPNTRLAPFDDVRVRRALSYAVDRARIRHLLGPTAGHATCQMLPPGFQGYRPYCPFTLHPDASGRWRGPNLAEARRLIAASGTKGMRISVRADPTLGFDRVTKYVTHVLDSLGYRARLQLEPNDYRLYGPSSPVAKRPGVQLTVSGWSPDYWAASNFFDFGWCQWYFGWFCDHKLGQLMKRAAGSFDPGVETARWTAVDHRFTDLAPVIPLWNGDALDVVSPRVGDYQYSPILRILLEDMWVR